MAKVRLDLRVVDDGLATDRREATGLIMKGVVLVNDRPGLKPGMQIRAKDVVRLRSGHQIRSFVSRGGEKLNGALKDFDLTITGLRCMDVGASTGGFTDCLLRHGAAGVIAVDVGYGLLADGLRRDPRVHVLERTNARYLTPDLLPWPPELMVADASFISLRTLLPAMTAVATADATLVAMVKPQFELARHEVPAGGVVVDVAARLRAVANVVSEAEKLGWKRIAEVDSQVAGPSGNRERFVLLRRREVGP